MLVHKQYQTINNKFNHQTGIKNISFGAGLTPELKQQIENCDVTEISGKLSQEGINSDFKDNKVVAWCADKAVQIFEELNKKYQLGLVLPKAVIVEDFSNLNVEDPEMFGLCNWFNSRLIKNSQEVVPQRALFFNSQKQWENIDEIMDQLYTDKDIGSDHFLYPVVHEFSHSAHNGHLKEKLGNGKMLNTFLAVTDPDYVCEYNRRFGDLLPSEISRENQLELIADDMGTKISDSLDESLVPEINPFATSSYPVDSNVLTLRPQSELKNEAIKRQLLQKAWEGESLI